MGNIPNLCSCGSNQKYTICCGKFHKGKLHAPTAEALMRSRYCAYVLNKLQYIYRTWDEQTRPTLQSLREGKTENFISLEILSSKNGSLKDKDGTVEFIAKFKVGDDQFEHHENSTFRRVKNHWVYVDAI
jgi:SEC-C motif-containing protein